MDTKKLQSILDELTTEQRENLRNDLADIYADLAEGRMSFPQHIVLREYATEGLSLERTFATNGDEIAILETHQEPIDFGYDDRTEAQWLPTPEELLADEDYLNSPRLFDASEYISHRD